MMSDESLTARRPAVGGKANGRIWPFWRKRRPADAPARRELQQDRLPGAKRVGAVSSFFHSDGFSELLVAPGSPPQLVRSTGDRRICDDRRRVRRGGGRSDTATGRRPDQSRSLNQAITPMVSAVSLAGASTAVIGHAIDPDADGSVHSIIRTEGQSSRLHADVGGIQCAGVQRGDVNGAIAAKLVIHRSRGQRDKLEAPSDTGDW